MGSGGVAAVVEVALHVNVEAVAAGAEAGDGAADQDALVVLVEGQLAVDLTSAAGGHEHGLGVMLKASKRK
jgi:hypothetical protein